LPTSTRSLHDALPISQLPEALDREVHRIGHADDVEAFGEYRPGVEPVPLFAQGAGNRQIDIAILELLANVAARRAMDLELQVRKDRKSTRLNSSHEWI